MRFSYTLVISSFIWALFLPIVWGRPNYVCPSQDFIQLGDTCYFLSTEIVSWQEAHFRCRDREAQLAVLESLDEDSYLREYLQQPEFAQLGRWIGGMWVGGSGSGGRKWVWAAEGNDIRISGFATSSVSNLPETEQWMCLYMDPMHRYRWSNFNCVQQLHYICEAPLQIDHEQHQEASVPFVQETTQEPFGSIEDLFYDDGLDDDDNDDDSNSDEDSLED